jgi:uncharacterized membrane protein YhaH (DUF805 family)
MDTQLIVVLLMLFLVLGIIKILEFLIYGTKKGGEKYGEKPYSLAD